jgi:hypothetical protein
MRPRQLLAQAKPVDWESQKTSGGPWSSNAGASRGRGDFGITGQLGGSSGRPTGSGDFGISKNLGGTSAGSGAGDFGVPTHLGCTAVPNPDAGRRFNELPDGGRCCPPPKGMNQSNPQHTAPVRGLPR